MNVPTTALIAMTEIPPTYVERRPVPQSTVQAAAQISGEVVEGLGRSPAVLGIVVLVAITVAAAIYFLQLLIAGQQKHLQGLLTVQQAHIKDLIDHHKGQLEQIVSVHNREFDALMEMAGRPREPVTGTQATPPPVRGRQ